MGDTRGNDSECKCAFDVASIIDIRRVKQVASHHVASRGKHQQSKASAACVRAPRGTNSSAGWSGPQFQGLVGYLRVVISFTSLLVWPAMINSTNIIIYIIYSNFCGAGTGKYAGDLCC